MVFELGNQIHIVSRLPSKKRLGAGILDRRISRENEWIGCIQHDHLKSPDILSHLISIISFPSYHPSVIRHRKNPTLQHDPLENIQTNPMESTHKMYLLSQNIPLTTPL